MSFLNRSHLKNSVPMFVLLVTQLHLLRNVSSLYLVLWVFAFVLSSWLVVSNWNSMRVGERRILYLVLLVYSWPMVATLPNIFNATYSGFSDIGTGLTRLIFSLPIYLVLLSCNNSTQYIFKLLAFIALISLIAALSIPYQFIFGSIFWFADNSERSGLPRFASLFGSLTSLGIVCGYGILAAVMSTKSTFFKTNVISGIILGSVLSLQKAAILNILIAFGAILVIQKPKLKGLLRSAFAFLPIVFMLSFYFFEEINQYLSSIRVASDDNSTFSDDVSILESIFERLIENPSIAIKYHGMESLFFGLGPIGGSGAFGYPEVPMSHNGLVDIFLIGGVPYFFILFIFFVLVLKLASIQVIDEGYKKIRQFGLLVFFLSIVNMIFSGLIIFAPSNAMFLAVALKCVVAPSRPKLDAHRVGHTQ